MHRTKVKQVTVLVPRTQTKETERELFGNTNEKPDALSYIGLEVAGAGLEPATFGL